MQTKKSVQTKKATTATILVLTSLIAAMTVAAVAAATSISSIPAAFAAADHQKDTRCEKGTQGGGDPHDAENPTNPHDTQLGYDIGNPHDECEGS